MSVSQKSPLHIIILLIVAGEAIFVLPFVIARVFKPTFLAAFGLSNYELGICMSIYGIVALFSYLFGGRLADKYLSHELMSTALLLTALGGFVMAVFPGYTVMKYVYGFFGFTTIFLFWSAMIKATRVWGGTNKQGRAFGLLDGGRGLVSVSFALLGVFVFSFFLNRALPADINDLTLVERKSAFRNVILVTSLFVAAVGLLVLFFMRQKNEKETLSDSKAFSISSFVNVLKLSPVWWLMIIILCAYTGYKITDYYSLYAKEVMMYNEIQSAKIGTALLLGRAIVGFSIGFLADKTKPVLIMKIGFIMIAFGSAIIASGILGPNLAVFFFVSISVTSLGVYVVRSLYFAVLEQANVPLALTGTAVGVISFIGYTPDIFVGPLMGSLLDNNPGELGHQYVFALCAVFALCGFFATTFFKRSSL
ncbi:MAG: MFS transporter [Crocinitomicaceae bacterium]